MTAGHRPIRPAGLAKAMASSVRETGIAPTVADAWSMGRPIERTVNVNPKIAVWLPQDATDVEALDFALARRLAREGL